MNSSNDFVGPLPVAGRYWQRVNTDTVMASSALLRSEEGVTKLRAVIRELAAQGYDRSVRPKRGPDETGLLALLRCR